MSTKLSTQDYSSVTEKSQVKFRAKQLADRHAIAIVNETDLAGMLEATDSRFDPAVLEILNDTRKLCPKCERELVLRTAGRGRGAGRQFWGCSGYAFGCRFTMPVG